MASQQPPARSWFRFATMAAQSASVPSPTPQPDPAPQPRPSAIRPTFWAPTLPTRTQIPAPVAAPAPPVTTNQVPPTSAAPITMSAPTAPAPAPIQQTPSASAPAPPRSPNTTVAPAAATSQTPLAAAAPMPPSPSVKQLPATTTRSSPSTLLPVSSTPKPSPPPTVLPESPKQKLPSPSPPPKYSPAPRTVSQVQTSPPKPSPYQAATFNALATTSTSFSKPINYQPNTPSPSPNSRPILHPPSPLTLPPAQLRSGNIQELNTPPEIEQKTVFVQETKEKSKASPNIHLPRFTIEPRNSTKPHKGEREASKNAHYKDKDKYKKTLDSDSGMRIVTIAGDNKGAIMELRPSRKKEELGHNFHKIGNFRTWGEEEKTGSNNSSSSEEGKSKKNKDDDRAATKALSIPYVNSNVQGVNNSILFNATCSHHDPGVHISVSRTPARRGRGFDVKKNMTKDD